MGRRGYKITKEGVNPDDAFGKNATPVKKIIKEKVGQNLLKITSITYPKNPLEPPVVETEIMENKD